jgi:hypothetical protein
MTSSVPLYKLPIGTSSILSLFSLYSVVFFPFFPHGIYPETHMASATALHLNLGISPICYCFRLTTPSFDTVDHSFMCFHLPFILRSLTRTGVLVISSRIFGAPSGLVTCSSPSFTRSLSFPSGLFPSATLARVPRLATMRGGSAIEVPRRGSTNPVLRDNTPKIESEERGQRRECGGTCSAQRSCRSSMKDA